MRRIMLALALFPMLGVAPLRAGPAEEAQALYGRFVAAQNAHDFAAVRATLLDDARFRWVTNGLVVRGPEEALARMRGFHANPVWRIDPAWDRAETVLPAPDTAVVQVPLLLTVGSAAAPDRYRILISALCVRDPVLGWRIAALFTTDENPEAPR